METAKIDPQFLQPFQVPERGSRQTSKMRMTLALEYTAVQLGMMRVMLQEIHERIVAKDVDQSRL